MLSILYRYYYFVGKYMCCFLNQNRSLSFKLTATIGDRLIFYRPPELNLMGGCQMHTTL